MKQHACMYAQVALFLDLIQFPAHVGTHTHCSETTLHSSQYPANVEGSKSNQRPLGASNR